ncbi:MAG: AAA family ATPase [Mycobacteriales bacterium]
MGRGAARLPLIRPPEFVGREREVAALAHALGQPPAVVLVEGEAGIGKSRLLQEFLAAPAGRPYRTRTLAAACPPLRDPYTLGPVVDAMRHAVDRAGDGGVAGLELSGLAGALRPLFPEWATDLPPLPEPVDDARAARHRLFRALLELLDRLRVAVLVVEDVHWADEATLEFLLFLASRLGERPSVLVSYRPEDVPAGSLLLRLSSRLPAGTTPLRLSLAPLDVAGTAGLVSSMLDGEHVSERFAAFLHGRTDGVPLALEESVRLMHDRAELARRDGAWVRRHLDEIDVPPTVRDAVRERTLRLGPDAQAVLRAAAVLTDPTDEATLLAVADLPSARAAAGLAEALDSGLLRADGQVLAFRHVLACWATHDAIPAPLRRQLHLRAGRAMEGRSPRPVARLARHFREAGETAEWCRYAEQAADLALASGDEATAVAAVHEVVTSGTAPAAVAARLARKIPFSSFTGPARYRELVGALRGYLAGGLPASVEAEIRYQLGSTLLYMEEYDAGLPELERAIPGLGHDPAATARAMILLGRPGGTSWTVSMHLRWLERAAEVTATLAEADRLPFLIDRVTALLTIGEGAGWAEAAQIPADPAGGHDPGQITRGQLNLGHSAMAWGRYAEARQRLARAAELAERYEHLRLRDMIAVTRTHLDYYTGRWDGLAERAAALAADEDFQPITRSEATLVAGLLASAAGQHEAAEERLRSVREETWQHGAREYALEPAAALARLWLRAGRVDDAVAVTGETIGVIAGKDTWVWATEIGPARTAALVAAGRVDEAAALADAFAAGLRGRDAPGPAAALVLCRALVAEAGGGHAVAAELYGEAARALAALPRPYGALLTGERRAHCLLAAGREEAGLALLGEVLDGLTALGAAGDIDRVRRDLRERGVDAPRPRRGGRPSYGDELSPRELEVVRLLLDGRTNREIAAALVLSRQTVASHVRSAMRKLKVSSRTALAVAAVELGLAPARRPDE